MCDVTCDVTHLLYLSHIPHLTHCENFSQIGKLQSGIVGPFENQISTFFWALDKHCLTLSWYCLCEGSIFNAKHLGYVSYVPCSMLFAMFHQWPVAAAQMTTESRECGSVAALLCHYLTAEE